MNDDDNVKSILTDKTVGIDQLETFDSSGVPGPGVTPGMAFAKVKEQAAELKKLQAKLETVTKERDYATELVASLQQTAEIRDDMEGLLAAIAEIVKLPPEPHQTWQERLLEAVEGYVRRLDTAVKALEAIRDGIPGVKLHAVDALSAIGGEGRDPCDPPCTLERGHEGPHKGRVVENQKDIKIEKASTEFNAELMGTDAALTRRVTRKELEDEYGASERQGHPEDDCDACGGRNITWSAPSKIWNAVMGGPNGILCPQCFDRRAAAQGYLGLWRFECARNTGRASDRLRHCVECGKPLRGTEMGGERHDECL